MAFDFGAALTAAGGVTPALQQAGENQRQRAREQVLDQLKARELQQWVPVRSYATADGAKHTVYLTPTGYQYKTEEPSYGEQIQSKVNAIKGVYKGEWTPDVERQVINQLAGIRSFGVKPLPGKQGEPFLGADGKWYHKVRNEETGQIEDEWMGANFKGPTTSSPPKLDWVDQYDEKSKQWYKVGYSKTEKDANGRPLQVEALPETKIGFGATPQLTRTWNPQVGEWVDSYRMPSPDASFGSPSQGAQTAQPEMPRSGSMPGPSIPPLFPSSGKTPPSSPSATIHKLSQPPRVASSSNAPPKVFRFDPQNPTIRGLGDSVASVMQQFVGSGNEPLWNYADLMDDPKKRAAINNALTMSMNAVPTVSEHPGFGQTVATALGLTKFAQSTINRQIQEARAEVQRVAGDRGVELVARLAELKSAAPALRAFSRTSAAQAAIAPLIQETPALNTMSSRDFRVRSSLILKTLAGALQSDPAINPQYTQWIMRQAEDAMKGGSTTAPRGAPKTADDYLNGVQ